VHVSDSLTLGEARNKPTLHVTIIHWLQKHCGEKDMNYNDTPRQNTLTHREATVQ